MDSKEALKILFMTCDEELLQDNYDILFASQLEEIIKKDLDVLEILKKKKVVIDWNSNDMFTFDEHLTKEEENKIKEWMKNDN